MAYRDLKFSDKVAFANDIRHKVLWERLPARRRRIWERVARALDVEGKAL